MYFKQLPEQNDDIENFYDSFYRTEERKYGFELFVTG